MNSFPPACNLTIGPNHHFFGYYDKCPWDASGRYLLALETRFIDRPPVADDTAVIGMIDLHEADRFVPFVETRAWNWQQGTMLRWLPNAPDRMVIYNQREGNRYVSVIRSIHSAENRTLPLPGTQSATMDTAQLRPTSREFIAVGRVTGTPVCPTPGQTTLIRMKMASPGWTSTPAGIG